LQGGPFSPEEIHRFELEPYHSSAIDLRKWDDAAKVPGLSVSGLEHYRQTLESVVTIQEGR
jgi:predicted HD phosphohydrolase